MPIAQISPQSRAASNGLFFLKCLAAIAAITLAAALLYLLLAPTVITLSVGAAMFTAGAASLQLLPVLIAAVAVTLTLIALGTAGFFNFRNRNHLPAPSCYLQSGPYFSPSRPSLIHGHGDAFFRASPTDRGSHTAVHPHVHLATAI